MRQKHECKKFPFSWSERTQAGEQDSQVMCIDNAAQNTSQRQCSARNRHPIKSFSKKTRKTKHQEYEPAPVFGTKPPPDKKLLITAEGHQLHSSASPSNPGERWIFPFIFA